MEANGEGGGEVHGCGWMYEQRSSSARRAPGQLAGGGSMDSMEAFISKKSVPRFVRSVLASRPTWNTPAHERSRDV